MTEPAQRGGRLALTDLEDTADRELIEVIRDPAAEAPGEARRLLTERYQSLVVGQAAKLHGGRGPDHEDVVAVAQHGLQKAIADYDPGHEAHFAAYARAKVRGEMMRWLRDDRYSERVARLLHERFTQIRRGAEQLQAVLHRQPDVEELAEHLDCPVAEIIEAWAVDSAERVRTRQVRTRQHDDDPDDPDAVAVLDAPEPDRVAAFEDLNERDRLLLYRRSTREASSGSNGGPALRSDASPVDEGLGHFEHVEWRIEPTSDTATDETSASLEEFATAVAHELRSSLAVVEQAAGTVLGRSDELEPDQMAEMLRMIQRNSRLATMMLGRLEMARGVEVGEVQLERELVDLAEIARETISDLADVLLRWHPTDVDAPAAVMVHADPTAVREILTNLLSNAAKYSPQGSCIDVAVVQRQHDAHLTVRDRGRGLTTADAGRAFEKFQQTDADSPGVGLGLYVSRGLARAQGGDLTVRPATVQGSEFRLALPNAAEG